MPTINLKKDGSFYIRIHQHGKIDTYQVTKHALPFLDSMGAIPTEIRPKINVSKDSVYEMLSKGLIFTEGTGPSDPLEKTITQPLPDEGDPSFPIFNTYFILILLVAILVVVSVFATF
jgi:hypothetical protein